MSKNIIICCDGTGNEFGNANSNVVKLYAILNKNTTKQVAYYDPGVGTMEEVQKGSSLRKKWTAAKGLALGYGLKKNVEEAYFYLMEIYEPGDRIFLFGFSRGAYTVRVLAGFIYAAGLLGKGCQNLFPYAFKLYNNFDDENIKDVLMTEFKATYSRVCPIHFMGVWDSVSSYGTLTKPQFFPYTRGHEELKTVRHAAAIDERRAHYPLNDFDKYALPKIANTKKRDFKEVWFAGAHSDVGGSYSEEESGLSKIALNWMVVEAKKYGLLIEKDRYKAQVLGNAEGHVAPNYKADIHDSLAAGWWILEYFPKIINHIGNKKVILARGKLYRDLTSKQIRIPTLHQSVVDRLGEVDDYCPSNIPEKYYIEPIEYLDV